MTIDRALWQRSLNKFCMPRWLCPACKQGHFVLVQNSFKFLPSRTGYVRLEHEPGERGYDLPLRFSGLAQCDNNACRETATISGNGSENWVYDDADRQLYCKFSPTYISPSPDLFPIPTAVPIELRLRIQSAFVLCWGDYESCLNRVRVCVEMVLDFLQVPRSKINGKKKEIFLNLYDRIEIAKGTHPAIVTAIELHLNASRLLGNVGSHSGGLNKEEVFDALELLEAILDGVYNDHTRVAEVAKNIIATRSK